MNLKLGTRHGLENVSELKVHVKPAYKSWERSFSCCSVLSFYRSISSSGPEHYRTIRVPIDLSHTSIVLSESCTICSQMCPILSKSPSASNKGSLVVYRLKPFLLLLLLALVLKLQESLKEFRRIGVPKRPPFYLLTHLYPVHLGIIKTHTK